MFVRNNREQLLKKFERELTVPNRIEVSKSAILHNVDLFKKLSGLKVIPVLKGNAYGHGIEQVAEALKGGTFPYIAVNDYFEALRIREISKQPVLIMGAILPENFAAMRYDKFAFVVQDASTIRALGKTREQINVHLECNTGMNRYGAQKDEIKKLTELILSYKNLNLEGVMSHLADSDGNDPATVDLAVEQFDTCIDIVRSTGATPRLIHIAQTGGSIKAKSAYANAIRLGVGLYGINPFPVDHILHTQLHDLRPSLRLVSTITHVIELQKGDRVSYNYTFTAPKAMKIGVIPVGYYEGVHRAFSNTGLVKIGSQFTPIVGRVCMNHTMISLEGVDASKGDGVIVYSNDPTDLNAIDHLATAHNLFNYSLLAGLNSNVRRQLVV